MAIEIMMMRDADWSTICEKEGMPNLRKVVRSDWLIKELKVKGSKNEV